jgi:squalene synthase HpnC
MLLLDTPIGAPSVEAVMARADTENFPVASRLLPHTVRRHLLAIYGFARLVDELGDGNEQRVGGPQQKLQALDWVTGELQRAYAGEASHPLLVRLEATVAECALPCAPFLALIEANRVDQRVHSYETWEQLLGYCELSANPVGELVLGVLGKATPERVARSNDICTALQLVEHWQDVAEDLARGRIYLPAEDRERFGCGERELAGEQGRVRGRRGGRARVVERHAGWRLRGLLAFEVARTRELLRRGTPLIATLHGRERLAVAGFAAGGEAALGAIERAGYDVLAGPPRAGRSPIARARWIGTLARALAGRPG